MVRRDWQCEVEGCGKSVCPHNHFSFLNIDSRDVCRKRRRRSIIMTRILGRVCPHEYCSCAFEYKHLLQRYLTKINSTRACESVYRGYQRSTPLHSRHLTIISFCISGTFVDHPERRAFCSTKKIYECVLSECPKIHSNFCVLD